MDWKNMPTRPGWYLFTLSLERWKTAFPVGVMQVGYPSGETGFRRLDVGLGSSYREDIAPDDGWWYGPLYVTPPDAPREAVAPIITHHPNGG